MHKKREDVDIDILTTWIIACIKKYPLLVELNRMAVNTRSFYQDIDDRELNSRKVSIWCGKVVFGEPSWYGTFQMIPIQSGESESLFFHYALI